MQMTFTVPLTGTPKVLGRCRTVQRAFGAQREHLPRAEAFRSTCCCLCMVMHACNLSIWETKVGRCSVVTEVVRVPTNSVMLYILYSDRSLTIFRPHHLSLAMHKD